MSYKAYIFVRPGGAIIGGSPDGHVGFGFQSDDAGTVVVGAVELKGGSTSHINDAMDFWTAETTEPLTYMSSQNRYGITTRYDMCKELQVANPNVQAARNAVVETEGRDYNLLSNNCRTDTVRILQAFGVEDLPGGARPSGFFGGIRGTIIPLTAPWPGLDLDFSIYSEYDQYGLRDDPVNGNVAYVADPTADINPVFDDGPRPVLSSFLVRKGWLALFPQQNYGGAAYLVGQGLVFNAKDLPWPDKEVCSWYASATEFDPSQLAAKTNEINPRFATEQQRADYVNGLRASADADQR